VYHSLTNYLFIGGAVIRDCEFKCTLKVTHKIDDYCTFTAIFCSLKETLLKARDYHLDNIKVDLEIGLIEKLKQALSVPLSPPQRDHCGN